MVGPEGVEPSTLGLKGPCSAGLSYRPMFCFPNRQGSLLSRVFLRCRPSEAFGKGCSDVTGSPVRFELVSSFLR